MTFRQTSDKKVAVFLANGLEEIEGLTVCDLLYRAGIPSDTVSITGTKDVTSSTSTTCSCFRAACREP